jgi:hypothetical protein
MKQVGRKDISRGRKNSVALCAVSFGWRNCSHLRRNSRRGSSNSGALNRLKPKESPGLAGSSPLPTPDTSSLACFGGSSNFGSDPQIIIKVSFHHDDLKYMFKRLLQRPQPGSETFFCGDLAKQGKPHFCGQLTQMLSGLILLRQTNINWFWRCFPFLDQSPGMHKNIDDLATKALPWMQNSCNTRRRAWENAFCPQV